jgi:hypothetical protein
MAMIKRAELHIKSEDFEAAILTFKETIQTVPTSVNAAERLAWLLLTVGDDNLRDIEVAYGIASHICSLTNFNKAEYLDLLSVAEAFKGDFSAAMKHCHRASILHRKSGNTDAEQISAGRIHDFRNRRIPSNLSYHFLSGL